MLPYEQTKPSFISQIKRAFVFRKGRGGWIGSFTCGVRRKKSQLRRVARCAAGAASRPVMCGGGQRDMARSDGRLTWVLMRALISLLDQRARGGGSQTTGWQRRALARRKWALAAFTSSPDTHVGANTHSSWSRVCTGDSVQAGGVSLS